MIRLFRFTGIVDPAPALVAKHAVDDVRYDTRAGVDDDGEKVCTAGDVRAEQRRTHPSESTREGPTDVVAKRKIRLTRRSARGESHERALKQHDIVGPVCDRADGTHDDSESVLRTRRSFSR